MNPIQLRDPRNDKPVNVWVCTECRMPLQDEGLAERCCQPCSCGKPTRNRFEAKCSDCWDLHYSERRNEQMEKAELVEWDGETWILSEDGLGNQDGWFAGPDELLEYCHDQGIEPPEFAFVGRKRVKKLDFDQAVESMLEDTYDGADLRDLEAYKKLAAAIEEFNKANAITYYDPCYKRKIRITDAKPTSQETSDAESHG